MGSGFKGKNNKLFMTRCFKCERENWAMAVASGQCAWCGYKMVKEDLKKMTEENINGKTRKKSF